MEIVAQEWKQGKVAYIGIKGGMEMHDETIQMCAYLGTVDLFDMV